MNELLKKYYLIDDANLIPCCSGYTFILQDEKYYFICTEYNEEYLHFLYDLTNNIKMIHNFVFNIDNKLLSDNYVLFKVNVLEDVVNLEDLNYFFGINMMAYQSNYISMDNIWFNKFDMFDKYINNDGDMLIYYYYDYFSGIGEMLIRFLSNYIIDSNSLLVLSHRSFKNNTIDFYCPLNLTVDFVFRDYAFYIRENNDYNLLCNILDNYKFNEYEYVYFFVRLLFPFKFFDLLKLINEDVNALDDVINSSDLYDEYIYDIENMFGIYIFSNKKE